MWRFSSFSDLTKSDVTLWIANRLAAGELSQLAALAALGLVLTLIGVGLTSRSRARRRRVKQQLVAQLRLGIQAAAERRASGARPTPATPARGTAEPAKPRVEPTAPLQAETSPGIPKREARARRAVKTPALEAEPPRATDPGPVAAQEELLDRIVKDAWGRALGGGRLAPSAGSRSRPAAERPPTPPAVEVPAAPIRASAPTPRPAPPARTQTPGSPDPLDRALAEAWSHALHQDVTPAQAGEGTSGQGFVDRRSAPGPTRPSRANGDTTPVDYVRLCESLLAKKRADEAARLAREGLAAHPGEGGLLLEVSRAEARKGRLEIALGAALAAHRAQPSRTSLTHLLRLATAARRFRPEDGERLRGAVRRHPDAPVLLHAAGVFEAMHGDPWAAIGLLRTALRLESDEAIRSEIERELARLEARDPGTRAA